MGCEMEYWILCCFELELDLVLFCTKKCLKWRLQTVTSERKYNCFLDRDPLMKSANRSCIVPKGKPNGDGAFVKLQSWYIAMLVNWIPSRELNYVCLGELSSPKGNLNCIDYYMWTQHSLDAWSNWSLINFNINHL